VISKSRGLSLSGSTEAQYRDNKPLAALPNHVPSLNSKK
jgi:hypothetical protein